MTEADFPTWQIGDYTITFLSDGHLAASIDLLQGIEPEQASAMQHDAGLSDESPMHINCYLVRGSGRTILIDAGAGGIKQWGGDLARALPSADVHPSDVDTILVTHAHPDHAGGLTDSSGSAVFSNAELVLSRREVEFWKDDANLARASQRARGNFLIARRALGAYADRIRTTNGGEVLPGISAVALPGHTHGHTGYLLGSGDESAIAWGDTVHFPSVQIRHPDVSVTLDSDPVRAAETRSELLELVSSEHLLVAGTHLHQGFAHVERTPEGYRIADDA
ncbi:MAG: MBL fold metallo-hydrolase [Nocardioides sp.]